MIKLRRYSYYVCLFAAMYIMVNIRIAWIDIVEYILYFIILLSIVMALAYLGKRCITVYVIGCVEFIMGIFQPIDSWGHMDVYSDTMRITSEMLGNHQLREEYLLILLISYILMYFTIGVVMSTRKMKYITTDWNHVSFRPLVKATLRISPIILCFIFSYLRYLFQMRFSILTHGGNTTINFVAVWVYFLRFIALYVWVAGWEHYLNSNLSTRKMIIYTFFLTLANAFPEILFGNRSSIITFLGQVVIAFLIHNRVKIATIIKQFSKYIVLFVLLALASITLSNYFRTGEYLPLMNFLRYRVTGIVDGVIAIKYLDGGKLLGFKSLLLSLIGDDNTRTLASFYTHNVVGYPEDIPHSYALPGFISSGLYGGIIGIAVGSVFVAWMLSVCESKMLDVVDRGNNVHELSITATIILSYVYTNTVMMVLLEGNIDNILTYLLPAIATYIAFQIIDVKFGKKYRRAFMG